MNCTTETQRHGGGKMQVTGRSVGCGKGKGLLPNSSSFSVLPPAFSFSVSPCLRGGNNVSEYRPWGPMP